MTRASAHDQAGGARLRVGTSSWSAPSWVGSFYPEGARPADFLALYARCFDTVEADVTYYRIPSRSMVQGWRRKTPPGFTLSAKYPRSVVHGGRGPAPDPAKVLVPAHVQRDSEAFLSAMRELGDKCGPLVLQFPYFNRKAFAEAGPFFERLDAFLGGLPGEFRFAVEVRNKNWVGAELLGILRSHGAALVLLDLVYMPHPDELLGELDLVTAPFVYARLIGDRKRLDALTERYDRIVVDQGPRLVRWAEVLRRLSSEVEEIFAYANNHYAGHGPATAAQLAALEREEEPPPAPRVPDSGELPF
jgi:uncharacterized protein YecE (DUF72 family)